MSITDLRHRLISIDLEANSLTSSTRKTAFCTTLFHFDNTKVSKIRVRLLLNLKQVIRRVYSKINEKNPEYPIHALLGLPLLFWFPKFQL